MSNCALITGITGQDGAYLAQLLLSKGYKVYGLLARRATATTWRLSYLGILEQVELIDGDLTDVTSLIRAVEAWRPPGRMNSTTWELRASWVLPGSSHSSRPKLPAWGH